MDEIDERVSSIAASLAEQAAGLMESTSRLNEIGTATQRNAEAGRLVARLGSSVSHEAAHLSTLVTALKLNRRGGQRDPDEVWNEQQRMEY